MKLSVGVKLSVESVFIILQAIRFPYITGFIEFGKLRGSSSGSFFEGTGDSI